METVNVLLPGMAKRRRVQQKRLRRPLRKGRRRAARAPKKRSVRKKAKAPDTAFLEALTGSPARARLLRFFLREPQLYRTLREVAERTGLAQRAVRREAALFAEIGILRVSGSRGARMQVNPSFPFLTELRTLAVRPFPIARSELIRLLSSVGTIKLVLVSGVFLVAERATTDLFIVADRFSEKRMERAVRHIEAAVGAELRWAGMETKEFLYRWKMFDRFVRDVLTQPHERVVEKIRV